MALKYEHFAFKRVVVEAHLWPPVGEISDGVLSQLFGHLNEDELFTSLELRPSGATFTGEYWTYDLSGSTVRIRCFGFPHHEFLRQQIRKLLDGTRAVKAHRRVAFYVAEIRVFAEVPEVGRRDIASVVQKRLLRGVKADQAEELPGLSGAGLSLFGETERYTWHADIDPNPETEALSLFAGISFAEPDPPRPGSDVEKIEEQVAIACDFVQGGLQAFATKLFP